MSIDHQDEQSRRQIVELLDQNFMVEAAAGTGKTKSIIDRMLNLIAEGVCDGQHLAAVTFTRKAAAELRQRFSSEVRKQIDQLQSLGSAFDSAHAMRLTRLQSVAQSVGQVFIDTIHSFCARLIRERPVEFGVDAAFTELEASAEESLRRTAWEQNLAELQATSDPLLDQLAAVGLRSHQLRQCFNDFLNYRDVTHWPIGTVEPPDFKLCRQHTGDYLTHIHATVAQFGSGDRDELMSRYEFIDRFRLRIDSTDRTLLSLLELFDRSPRLTQNRWPKTVAPKDELARFTKFRDEIARPALSYWRQYRYPFVVRFVRRAVECYQQLKNDSGGLDFTDLLLVTARGLRSQPHLRQYFQTRFSHLLVDEFQDTDPLQAEIVILLSSHDTQPTDWQRCRLRPGSLFIVGDPKQSIYRFRRGDIVTYNHVKAVVVGSQGRVLPLSRNFRSSPKLIAWNNQVFQQIFKTSDTNRDAVTEHSPMVAQERDQCGSLSGVFQLTIPKDAKPPIDWEAEQVAQFVRDAIDQRLTIEVKRDSQSDAWHLRPVRASDFLILMRNKKHIGSFKSALEKLGLECDATGSNALSGLEELRILQTVLRAVDDPYNPVPYLALLRDQLFGFSDAELFELKDCGGSFQFQASLPAELPSELRSRFERTNQLLGDCQLWLRSLPPAVAVTQIASALGLIASAAAGREGNLALGTLLKAIEMLRQRSWQFDSAADMISGLEELLERDEIEGMAAKTPTGRAVRVMNLHKAKGLEAPIVFLVDGSKRSENHPKHYIDRNQEQPQGYMWVTEPSNHKPRLLAEPGDWDTLQRTEQRFQDAEEDRLLYVATTRAANMLVVIKSPGSNWAKLEPYIADAPDVLKLVKPSKTTTALTSNESNQVLGPTSSIFDTSNLQQLWQQAMQPTYQTLSIKQEAVRGRRRPEWQVSTDEHGAAWGTALHQLLDMAMRVPTFDLDRQATAIAIENDIDAQQASELAAAIRSVMKSSIWQRACAAGRRFSEVPIDAAEYLNGRPTIMRGVIDLVFEEPDGWVIVDYKSDSVTQSGAATALEYYRVQLESYGKYWQQLTGTTVKELGIYLTRLDLYLVAE